MQGAANDAGEAVAEAVDQATQCGVIIVETSAAGAIEGFGAAGAAGLYFDRASGMWGTFGAIGGAVGAGASRNVIGFGYYSSFSAFQGTSGELSRSGAGLSISARLAPQAIESALDGALDFSSATGGGLAVSLGGGIVGTSTFTTPSAQNRFAPPNPNCR